jgi:hypothetical protein
MIASVRVPESPGRASDPIRRMFKTLEAKLMRGIGGGMVIAESSVGPAQPYQGGRGVAVGVGVIVGVEVDVGVKTIVGVAVGSAGRKGVAVGGDNGLAVTRGISIASPGFVLSSEGALHESMARMIKARGHACLGTALRIRFTSLLLIGLTLVWFFEFPICLPHILIPYTQDARSAPNKSRIDTGQNHALSWMLSLLLGGMFCNHSCAGFHRGLPADPAEGDHSVYERQPIGYTSVGQGDDGGSGQGDP